MASRNVSFYGPMSKVLGGGPIQRDYRNDPRRMLGQQALEAGSSTAPVQSPLEGIARALQGGLGGYFAGQSRQEMKDRESAHSDAMTQALSGLGGYEQQMPEGQQGPPQMLSGIQGALAAGTDTGNADIQPFLQQLQMQGYEAEQAAQLAELESQRARENYLFEQENKAFRDGPDTVINMGGELKKGFRPVVDPVTGESMGAEFIPGGSEDPEVIRAGKEAERLATLAVKDEEMMPGRRGDIMTKIEREPALLKAISDIKELSEGWATSGVTGQLLGGLAGSAQYALEAKLQTVKSAVGLEELIRVKAAGGTFGALSDTEMTLLISAVGALDGNLPPDQLGPVLDEVAKLYSKGLERKKTDFKERYPDVARPWESSPPAATDEVPMIDQSELDTILNKYLSP